MDGDALPRLRRPDTLRVVDRAFASLEDAILTGAIPPGTRLVEQTLATQLAVSRTTIREALLMLERQGVVESTPRGGTFVTRLTSDAAWDVCKIRALLEGYAVRAGFPTYDTRLFATMRGIAADIRACTVPDDVPRLVALDLEFHRLIVARARSPYLLDLWATMNGKIRALYLMTMEQMQIHPSRIAVLHEQLVDDLASGDLDRAERGMLSHYLDGWPRTPEESAEMRHILGVLAAEWHWQSRVDREGKCSSCG